MISGNPRLFILKGNRGFTYKREIRKHLKKNIGPLGRG